MSTIKKGLKKTVKIVLSSWQTASWTGMQFDAFYSIDFSKIITDPADFDKAYDLSFSFRSRKTNTGVTFSSFSIFIGN